MGEHDAGECDDALHQLYHFLDGELTPETRAQIKNHLDDCPPCIEVFDFEAELLSMIAHKCTDTVPESLRQRVADALKHESLPPH